MRRTISAMKYSMAGMASRFGGVTTVKDFKYTLCHNKAGMASRFGGVTTLPYFEFNFFLDSGAGMASRFGGVTTFCRIFSILRA